MKTRNEKNKFLFELREIPIVSVVCKRTGIGKSTVYRWLKNDKRFKSQFDEAMDVGRNTISDLAEGTIIGAMRKGSLRASEYWLENNTDRYYRPKKPKDPRPPYQGVTQFNIQVYQPPKDGNSTMKTSFQVPPPDTTGADS